MCIYILRCGQRCLLNKATAWVEVMPDCKCAFFIPFNRKLTLKEYSYCPTVPDNGCILRLEDFLASYFCREMKLIMFFRLDERHMDIFIFALPINITPQEVRIKNQKRCFIFALFLNELNKLFSLVLGSGRPEMQE